jgi:hypothetical protein
LMDQNRNPRPHYNHTIHIKKLIMISDRYLLIIYNIVLINYEYKLILQEIFL